jgi:dTMP kinase
MNKPLFITFEGGEGSGKTTQIKLLQQYLLSKNIDCITTREPGGCENAESIRNLLLSGAGDKWNAISETLLFQAARIEHIEKVIKPALLSKKIVLCDRFLDSTIVYQGIGKGLGGEYIKQLYQMTVGNFTPDLTFILDIEPEIGLKRSLARNNNETRFENMDISFHHKVRNGFLQIAQSNQAKYKIIDANQDIITIYNLILLQL